MSTNDSGQLDRDLAEATERLQLIRANLPKQVDIVALGVKEKLPWGMLNLREALIWRIYELGYASLECIKCKNAVAAVVLVRALLESVALLWSVRRLFDDSPFRSRDELANKVERMLFGSRVDAALPQSISVLSFIDSLDEKYPGVRRQYDEMSELAHPSFRGVHGSYASIDKEKFITFYGRDSQAIRSSLRDAANILVACLVTTEITYNEMADLFPDFLTKFTPLP